jgi:hypothetical protein
MFYRGKGNSIRTISILVDEKYQMSRDKDIKKQAFSMHPSFAVGKFQQISNKVSSGRTSTPLLSLIA